MPPVLDDHCVYRDEKGFVAKPPMPDRNTVEECDLHLRALLADKDDGKAVYDAWLDERISAMKVRDEELARRAA